MTLGRSKKSSHSASWISTCMNRYRGVDKGRPSLRGCLNMKMSGQRGLAMIDPALNLWHSAQSTTVCVNTFLKITISWYSTLIGILLALLVLHMIDFQIINKCRDSVAGHKARPDQLTAEEQIRARFHPNLARTSSQVNPILALERTAHQAKEVSASYVSSRMQAFKL